MIWTPQSIVDPRKHDRREFVKAAGVRAVFEGREPADITSPLDFLFGHIHYIDPADTLALEGDGNPCDTVVNQIGGDLTGQTAGLRPTINSNVIGGKPALNFDNTQRAWATAQDTNDGGVAGALMYLVMQTSQSPDTSRSYLASMPETAAVDTGFHIKLNATSRAEGGLDLNTPEDFRGILSPASPTFNDGNPHIFIIVWEPGRSGGLDFYLRVDGAEVANSVTTGTVMDTSLLQVVLGDDDATGLNSYNGDLGIVGICNLPNVSFHGQLESFLDTFYGGGIIP